MLKLLIDENLDQRILRGLRLQIPDLLYTVVQETALAGARDPALLEWATHNHHVLVTHDRETMLKAMSQRMRSGQETGGVVIVKKEPALSRAVEDLVLLVQSYNETDLENQVVFIPF